MGLLPALMGAGINAGMGLLLEGHNDRRQIEQQKRLQELQMQGQKQMTDYNYGKQLQMWKDTGYEAQMQQLKEAGLNPALLYGKGGTGGMTVGSGGGANVQGATAPTGGMEIMNMMMQKAQIALMEAQTKKTTVEAEKTAGVDTELTKTQTDSLTQGITNQKTANELMEIEAQILGVKYEIDAQTMNHIISNVKKGAAIIANDENISTETKASKIQLIQAEAIGAGLRNALTAQQTTLTKQHTEESKAKVIQIGQEIMQKWAGLNIEQQKVLIQEKFADIAAKEVNIKLNMAKLETLHRTFNQIMKFREMPSLPIGVPPIQ